MLRANAAINVGDCLSLLHHNLPHLLPPMEDSQSKALPTQQREETADMRHNLLCLLHPINSQSAQREEMNGLPSQGSGSREWQLDQVTDRMFQKRTHLDDCHLCYCAFATCCLVRRPSLYLVD
jgi:hypothetical protein